MRFVADGPFLPDELLVARDEGRVLFFFGAGVSRAQAGLPGFLGLAERVLKELRALPDSPAGKLVDLAARLQEERIEGVGGILAADRIFGLLERDFAIADIEHAVGRALRPQPGANLDAHRTLVEAAGRRRCRNARRLRPRAFASRVCERPRDLDVLAEEVRPKKKPRTIELYTHYLCKLVGPRLASRKALEVTPAAVDNLHRRLGAKTPVSANRVIVALSGVYTFAARRRLIADGVNPARGSVSRVASAICRRTSSRGSARCCAPARSMAWPGREKRAGRPVSTIASRTNGRRCFRSTSLRHFGCCCSRGVAFGRSCGCAGARSI